MHDAYIIYKKLTTVHNLYIKLHSYAKKSLKIITINKDLHQIINKY